MWINPRRMIKGECYSLVWQLILMSFVMLFLIRGMGRVRELPVRDVVAEWGGECLYTHVYTNVYWCSHAYLFVYIRVYKYQVRSQNTHSCQACMYSCYTPLLYDHWLIVLESHSSSSVSQVLHECIEYQNQLTPNSLFITRVSNSWPPR